MKIRSTRNLCNPAYRHVLWAALVAVSLMAGGCSWFRSDPPACPMPGYAEYNRGVMFMAEERPAEAARALTQALTVDPYIYPGYYHLGLAYLELDRAQDASSTWRRGIAVAGSGPDRPDYDRNRAAAEMTAALAGLDAENQGRMSATPKPAPVAPARMVKSTSMKEPATSGQWAVLFSSNLKPASAAGDRVMLEKMGITAMIKPAKLSGRMWHRVIAGCCSSRQAAMALKAKLTKLTGRGDLMVMKPGG